MKFYEEEEEIGAQKTCLKIAQNLISVITMENKRFSNEETGEKQITDGIIDLPGSQREFCVLLLRKDFKETKILIYFTLVVQERS